MAMVSMFVLVVRYHYLNRARNLIAAQVGQAFINRLKAIQKVNVILK